LKPFSGLVLAKTYFVLFFPILHQGFRGRVERTNYGVDPTGKVLACGKGKAWLNVHQSGKAGFDLAFFEKQPAMLEDCSFALALGASHNFVAAYKQVAGG
jgi:hypothetical protein